MVRGIDRSAIYQRLSKVTPEISGPLHARMAQPPQEPPRKRRRCTRGTPNERPDATVGRYDSWLDRWRCGRDSSDAERGETTLQTSETGLGTEQASGGELCGNGAKGIDPKETETGRSSRHETHDPVLVRRWRAKTAPQDLRVDLVAQTPIVNSLVDNCIDYILRHNIDIDGCVQALRIFHNRVRENYVCDICGESQLFVLWPCIECVLCCPLCSLHRSKRRKYLLEKDKEDDG